MAARKPSRQDPLGDLDGGEKDDKHTENAVERIEKDVESSDDKPDPVIRLDEDDDEPDDEPRETRRDRKAQRGKVIEENETLRQQATRAQEMLQQTLAWQQQQIQQQGQPKQEDPAERYQKQLEKRRDLLTREGTALGNNPRRTQAELEDYAKRVSDWEGRNQDFAVQRNLHRMGIRPQQQEHPALTAARAQWPDIMSDPQLANRLLLENQLACIKGAPDTWETTQRIAESIRQSGPVGKGGLTRASGPLWPVHPAELEEVPAAGEAS